MKEHQQVEQENAIREARVNVNMRPKEDGVSLSISKISLEEEALESNSCLLQHRSEVGKQPEERWKGNLGPCFRDIVKSPDRALFLHCARTQPIRTQSELS